MADIALQGVTKIFPGNARAVSDLSFTMAAGECLALLGPSGSGKTTTLRLIAGLEDPTSGFVRFDGKIANSVPPSKRNVALVFQRFNLYPYLSVRQNLGFGLRARA